MPPCTVDRIKFCALVLSLPTFHSDLHIVITCSTLRICKGSNIDLLDPPFIIYCLARKPKIRKRRAEVLVRAGALMITIHSLIPLGNRPRHKMINTMKMRTKSRWSLIPPYRFKGG